MKSFPWDSIVTAIADNGYPELDRACDASDLRMYLKRLFSDGILMDTSDCFAVTPNGSMTVSVSPGACIISGSPAEETDTRDLNLTASGNLGRIDTIVIRWDNNKDVRWTDLFVKEGTPSTTPERPALTDSETVKELGLCDIYISAGVTEITANMIVDTRLESERCGVASALLKIDTTTFFNQLKAATNTAVEMSQELLDETFVGKVETYMTETDEFKDSINDIITNDNSSASIEGGYGQTNGYVCLQAGTTLDNNTASLCLTADDDDPIGAITMKLADREAQKILVEISDKNPYNGSSYSYNTVSILSEDCGIRAYNSNTGNGVGFGVGSGGNNRGIYDYAASAWLINNNSSNKTCIPAALPLYINGTGMTDFVVAQGTSGIWTYTKYNSGIAICAGTKSFTVKSWSNTGNAEVCSYQNMGTILFPFSFTSAPAAFVYYQSGSVCFASSSNTATNAMDVRIAFVGTSSWRGSSIASVLGFCLIGQWK